MERAPPKKEEEEEDDETSKPPKFKDPFASLPKRLVVYSMLFRYNNMRLCVLSEPSDFIVLSSRSPFVLDAFKRVYSNEDTATKAIPYFWENFDKEGWSLWKAEYKYPDELKKIFMTSNLVSGMMQRLDKLRKNAFASVLIMGKDNDNIIEGVWVLRGPELAFSVSTN